MGSYIFSRQGLGKRRAQISLVGYEIVKYVRIKRDPLIIAVASRQPDLIAVKFGVDGIT